MALNIGNILNAASSVLGGITAGGTTGQVLQTVSGLTNIASQFVPQPSAVPTSVVMAPSAAVPVANRSVQIIPQGASGPAGLTKEVFDAGIKVFNAVGIAASAVPATFVSALKRILSALARFARGTPVGTLVSVLLGLGLTAYEANLLTAWYATKKKSRRMNPANAKALRRAARRIRSFHRLCVHTDLLKSRRRSTSARCVTCKRNPCRC